ncbi:T7SS effector LXG polymorphic toxin [Heyndrickxia faecalis]|uniref:T7SS effector LXG polymorphic toxin n=1 Tax=Heyndrickxia faecalis TaxID=2824910 RepID=UPI003D20C979
MGNKVEMTEVDSFSDELKSAASSLKSQLDAIKKSANQIAEMDSFTGLTADSAKDYLKDFHMKIADNFTTLFESLSTQLSSHIVSFQSEVDSSNAAHLDSDYLKDEQTKLNDQYSKVSESHSSIKAIIQKISDISSLTPPSLSDAANDKKTAVQLIQKTEDKLHSFTSKGKNDAAKMDDLLDQLEAILQDVGKMDKGNRFSEYYNGSAKAELVTLNKAISQFNDVKTLVSETAKGYKLLQVAKNAGLQTEVVNINGKKYYRIYATKEALEKLGINPDQEAIRQLNKGLPKNNKKPNAKQLKRAENNKATLKYATKKKGQSGWSKTGEAAIQKYKQLEYWNEEPDLKYMIKSIGKATVKGAKDALKDAVNLKPFLKSRSFSKALGPVGSGLSYYSNYHDAKDDGLNVKKAAARATVDTGVDLAVSGAIQGGLTIAANLLIPGVGLVVGYGFSLMIVYMINKRSKDGYGREKKDSYMDKLKSWYH